MDIFKPKIKPAAYSYSSSAGPATLSLTPPLQPPAKRLRDDDSAAVVPSDISQSRATGPSQGKLAFYPRDRRKRRVFSLNGLSSMIGWKQYEWLTPYEQAILLCMPFL